MTAAGIRVGSPAAGSPASVAALGVESLGDSAPAAGASDGSLDGESLGDPPSAVGFSDGLLDGESLGDSGSRGDSEGLLGVPDGEAEGVPEVVGLGVADGELPPPFPPLPPWPPLPPDPPEPPEPSEPWVGVAVGDGVGDEVVGVCVGLGGATGGETDGGTVEPLGRPCCHDQPTLPPAGTVWPPTPVVAKVHEPVVPSDHHSPQ